MTALFILSELGALDLLKKLYPTIAVASSSIDELRQLIEMFETIHSQGYSTILNEHKTQEQAEKIVEPTSTLLGWCQSHCRVLPCNPLLTMDASRQQELFSLYGRSFAETLLIAEEKGYALYSDDAVSGTYVTVNTVYARYGVNYLENPDEAVHVNPVKLDT